MAAGLACGGGTPEPVPPVVLDGCDAWEPPAPHHVDPVALADVIDHTPADFVAGVNTHRVEVTLGGRTADVPQIRIVDGAVSSDVVFKDAAPVHTDGTEPLLLLLHVTADVRGHSLLGRTTEVAITLGDAVIRFQEDGHVDEHISVPGVALHPGDRIAYSAAGGQLLTSTLSSDLSATFDGDFPVVLGDDRQGVEIRAIDGSDRDALMESRLSAFDKAFPKTCQDASIDPNYGVPAWDPRYGVLATHEEDVAAVNGWTDPRLEARLARIDRVYASWKGHLANLYAQVAAAAAPTGDAVAFDGRTITVSAPVVCTARPEPYCTTSCRGALTVSTASTSDDNNMMSGTAVLRSGAAGSLDVTGDPGGKTWPFKLCFTEPPADDDPILYRPYRAESWLRLR